MFRGLILADLCGKVPAMLYRVWGEALLRAEFLRCQFEAVFLLFFGFDSDDDNNNVMSWNGLIHIDVRWGRYRAVYMRFLKESLRYSITSNLLRRIFFSSIYVVFFYHYYFLLLQLFIIIPIINLLTHITGHINEDQGDSWETASKYHSPIMIHRSFLFRTLLSPIILHYH